MCGYDEAQSAMRRLAHGDLAVAAEAGDRHLRPRGSGRDGDPEIDARIVIASVDTYLRFAEAVNRLDIREDDTAGLPELMESVTSGGAKSKTRGAIEAVKEKVTGDEDGDKEKEKAGSGWRSSSRRRSSSRS